MTAPQTPPLSAEDAREAALAGYLRAFGVFYAEPCNYAGCIICVSFRAGWESSIAGPTRRTLAVVRSLVDGQFRAGRRAALAYARTLAKEARP